jgi:hypothetical protein
MRVSLVAQRFAQQGDRVGKVRLLHERPRPDLLQQLLFGDEMAGAADQRHQQIERLRRKRDCLFVAQESLFRLVEPVPPECVHVARGQGRVMHG